VTLVTVYHRAGQALGMARKERRGEEDPARIVVSSESVRPNFGRKILIGWDLYVDMATLYPFPLVIGLTSGGTRAHRNTHGCRSGLSLCSEPLVPKFQNILFWTLINVSLRLMRWHGDVIQLTGHYAVWLSNPPRKIFCPPSPQLSHGQTKRTFAFLCLIVLSTLSNTGVTIAAYDRR